MAIKIGDRIKYTGKEFVVTGVMSADGVIYAICLNDGSTLRKEQLKKVTVLK
jgi:hypothetical protein